MSTGARCGRRRSPRPCAISRRRAIASCWSSSRTRASARAHAGASSARSARIGYDHADVLLLGFWNRGSAPAHPRRRAHAAAAGPRATSSPSRATTARWRPRSPASGDFDIVHLRYNAAHPGAERDCLPAACPPRTGPASSRSPATSWGQLLNPAVHAGRRAHADGERLLPVRALSSGRRCMRDRTGVGRARRAGPRRARAGADVAKRRLAWMRRVGVGGPPRRRLAPKTVRSRPEQSALE